MEGMSDLAEKARCEVIHNHANVSTQDIRLSYLETTVWSFLMLIA